MTRLPRNQQRSKFAGDDDRRPLAEDLERLAHWMDSVFRIPGIGWRFGLDALLGLLPGAGDIATSLVSVYIFAAAQRHGVSRTTLARMAMNIVIDLLLGAIPFVGDLFDMYWKANKRNVELLRRHAAASPQAARRLRTSDRLFVAALVLLLLGLLVASLALAYFALAWLLDALQRASN